MLLTLPFNWTTSAALTVTVLVYQKSPFDKGALPTAETKSHSGIKEKPRIRSKTSRELRGSDRSHPRRRF